MEAKYTQICKYENECDGYKNISTRTHTQRANTIERIQNAQSAPYTMHVCSVVCCNVTLVQIKHGVLPL